MPADAHHFHQQQRHGNQHNAHQTPVPKMEFSPTNNNHHHQRFAEGNGKVSIQEPSDTLSWGAANLLIVSNFQNGSKSGVPSPIQSFMGPSAAAAAAAAAAMGQNFVLFPFLDQLHHSGAFQSPLQSMQPFLQKNNVSSSCSRDLLS